MKVLAPSAAANIKHKPMPRQVNIKHPTKGLFTFVPITQYIFSKNVHGMPKIEEKTHSKETKLASEPDSDTSQMLE